MPKGIYERIKPSYRIGKTWEELFGFEKSKEMRIKQSIYRKGRTSPMLGKKHTVESKRKMSESLKGMIAWNKGKHHSEEARNKMSESHIGKLVGCNNPSWKGGVTPKLKKIRNSLKYLDWREAVFERDDFTCQECGDRSSVGNQVYLHAHHLDSFAEYPELRFDVENGITTCKDCHIHVHQSYLRQSIEEGI